MSSKRLLGIAAILALALVSTGCSTSSVSSDKRPEPEVVRISGSGTCAPLLRLLTDTYDGEDAEWRYLPGLHSGGGITGVANGDLDIGAVSRDLTEEEKQLGLVYTVLSNDGIVIAVHPSTSVTGLTTAQVRDIYAGVYTNWQELGGADLPITILDRNEDESAKIIMRKYVLGEDLAISPKAANLYYEVDMVNGVQSTVGAIGYFSLGYGVSRDVPVTFMELDGVAPTVENIEAGRYPVVRPLGVVTDPEPSAAVQAFLEWATSDEAVELIESNGFASAR